MTGFVSLVGAGPGDPELLTLKAVRRLQEADLILHDALVSQEILALAPRARRFFVGKRANRPSMEQETINRLLIRAARRGERVVRLKCGDPFVLGRGGEEGLALAAEGIAFEVVPGISSAVAAPALAGIPVTHRGKASAFLVVSGHAEKTWRPILEGLAPGSVTLVILMGLGNREALSAFLQSRGWTAETPVAVLLNASHPDGSNWFGTLSTLATTDAPAQTPDAAGIIVVGDVVSLAPQLQSQQPPQQETAQLTFRAAHPS
ncbi:MAG: uroporphyrinogen-III C-methyltransferase [Myxococcota bacterium]